MGQKWLKVESAGNFQKNRGIQRCGQSFPKTSDPPEKTKNYDSFQKKWNMNFFQASISGLLSVILISTGPRKQTSFRILVGPKSWKLLLVMIFFTADQKTTKDYYKEVSNKIELSFWYKNLNGPYKSSCQPKYFFSDRAKTLKKTVSSNCWKFSAMYQHVFCWRYWSISLAKVSMNSF